MGKILDKLRARASSLVWVAESKVIEERTALCNKCEHYLHSTLCKKCGCYMNVKIRIANASCPVGKWQRTAPKETAS
jgi:hypothetical protein